MSKRLNTKKFRVRKTSRKKFKALLAAALAIPGLGLSTDVQGQTPVEKPVFRFEYSYYKDYQPGEDRMEVTTPSWWLKAPLGSKTELETSLVYDTMSGASPYFLSSLSGASGLGIDDRRTAADLKVTHYFENFSLGFGGAVSSEDDYTSRGGSIEGKIWTPDKNRTYSFGLNFNSDSISATNNPFLEESRKTVGYFAGLTQVINQRSIIQSNINYVSGDGYFSDPYKTFDLRPRSREYWAWLNRYRLYFPESGGALHTDYRLYFDTWGVDSHTVEVAWYQPLGENWIVRPSIRYYTQARADFFSPLYPPEDFEKFYSTDQRVADFGGITYGLKIIRELGRGISVDAKYEYLMQKDSLKLGSHIESDIESFYASTFSVGFTKKFS